MADWFITTEGVKVLKDSASLWPHIIGGILTAGAAFGSVWHGQRRVAKLKKEAREEMLIRERLLVASELVFILEQFAEACARVATDHGYLNRGSITLPEITVPTLSYSSISGDWQVLPEKLMYCIRELPTIKAEVDRDVNAAEAFSADYRKVFEFRQYQYARLGLKAIFQSRRLRQLAGLPDIRHDASSCAAQNILWNVWRQQRKRRYVQAMMDSSHFAESDYGDTP